MPQVEETPAIKAARSERIKVSRITIKAQPDGTRLWSGRVVRRNSTLGKWTYNSEFRLKGEFAKTVRNALNNVFELDRVSPRSLDVTAMIRLRAEAAKSTLCGGWDTKTSISLDIAMISKTGVKSEKKHYADVDESFCIILMAFPGEDAINNNVQKAFQDVIADAVTKWTPPGT